MNSNRSSPFPKWEKNPELQPHSRTRASGAIAQRSLLAGYRNSQATQPFLVQRKNHRTEIHLISDVAKLKEMLIVTQNTLNDEALVRGLPDGGNKLKQRFEELRKRLAELEGGDSEVEDVNTPEVSTGSISARSSSSVPSTMNRPPGPSKESPKESPDSISQLAATLSTLRVSPSTPNPLIPNPSQPHFPLSPGSTPKAVGLVKPLPLSESIALEQEHARALEEQRLQLARERMENESTENGDRGSDARGKRMGWSTVRADRYDRPYPKVSTWSDELRGGLVDTSSESETEGSEEVDSDDEDRDVLFREEMARGGEALEEKGNLLLSEFKDYTDGHRVYHAYDVTARSTEHSGLDKPPSWTVGILWSTSSRWVSGQWLASTLGKRCFPIAYPRHAWSRRAPLYTDYKAGHGGVAVSRRDTGLSLNR
ncbi:uncharacterized protein EV422DRAFT_623009 [Fimicolochytrium jonesii]|uniref:uncharacterized protein n=1 Tax=Fimicolochytrium jonesii TaxID=1396493 RepID=UPI0022FE8A31|nr:uncharacterized protein EV422DRAFT_623009 [Fimicolochytrium jonesii]KAI8816937.1 hypothetical protein EV422DRAFT_623009 [Fimicolochytrium jonesii]